MYVLVLQRWSGDADALAQVLAEALGKSLSEARARLSGSGPIVVATFPEIEPAIAMAGALRPRGIAELLLIDSDDEPGARRCLVRSFNLGDRALRVDAHPHRQEIDIPYGEIELLLRGTHVEAHTTRDKYSTREFSLARTLMSGGIFLTKSVSAVRTRQTEERTAFLHLYARERPVVILRETDLRFQSLGPALRPSRQANFQHLVAELRRRAPAALYDDRLVQRAGQVQLLGPGLSPDRHLALALSVLARTLRR